MANLPHFDHLIEKFAQRSSGPKSPQEGPNASFIDVPELASKSHAFKNGLHGLKDQLVARALKDEDKLVEGFIQTQVAKAEWHAANLKKLPP